LIKIIWRFYYISLFRENREWRLLKKQDIFIKQRRKVKIQFKNRLLRSYLPADIDGGATWRETIFQMVQVFNFIV